MSKRILVQQSSAAAKQILHGSGSSCSKRQYANKILQIHSKNLLVDPTSVRFDPVNVLPSLSSSTSASSSILQQEKEQLHFFSTTSSSTTTETNAAAALSKERIDQILEFWFGKEMLHHHSKPDQRLPGLSQRLDYWFSANEETDKSITEHFEQDLQTLVHLRRSGQNVLELSAHGLLASIIILDQFPRNMYRSTPKAYKYDATALVLAKKTVESSTDLLLQPVHRAFVYLPFMHSEAILDQVKSVQLYKQLLKDPSIHADDKPLFQGFLKQAEEYLKIIERFGRFPHRNEILGRATTKEEAEFMKEASMAKTKKV